MKFGGEALRDEERVLYTANVVKKFKKEETIVVVSAMSGITDKLYDLARNVINMNESEIRREVEKIKRRHEIVINKCVHEKYKEECKNVLNNLSEKLERTLLGISYVGELTPRSLDLVLSFGERLIAPIFSYVLKSIGINSLHLTGYEAGIVTDSNFGRANPIWEKTKVLVRERVEKYLKDRIPVITGYIAADEKGRITTLGRGGSDYTATIIGSCLDADEIWLFKDVKGLMTADPKIIPEAKIIRKISYIEAMELAYFGAKILHPKALEPAMEKNIPVRIKPLFNPEDEGTLITAECMKSKDIVKAIAVKKNVASLNIFGAGMVGLPGIAARIFNALAKNNINILMISQGSSETNISLVVEREDVDRAIEAIKEEFKNENVIKNIDCNRNVAILAVVGAGMKGTKGVAARVFSAVAKAGVNILMISQGSSEVNISFVVDEKDSDIALRALHKEFISQED